MKPRTRSTRLRRAGSSIALAGVVALATLGGCTRAAPAEPELRAGLVQIMTGLGLDDEGAARVSDCMVPELLQTADPDSLTRLAEGRHAVVPADERPISALEAECLLATD